MYFSPISGRYFPAEKGSTIYEEPMENPQKTNKHLRDILNDANVCPRNQYAHINININTSMIIWFICCAIDTTRHSRELRFLRARHVFRVAVWVGEARGRSGCTRGGRVRCCDVCSRRDSPGCVKCEHYVYIFAGVSLFKEWQITQFNSKHWNLTATLLSV